VKLVLTNSNKPYLIDYTSDNSSINLEEINEGVIPREKGVGRLHRIDVDQENWVVASDTHFHDQKTNQKYIQKENIIYYADRPDISLLNIIEKSNVSKIGFIFRDASILSHLCILFRDRNIPVIVLSGDTPQPGVAYVLDTSKSKHVFRVDDDFKEPD
jgi:hypothetical protein